MIKIVEACPIEYDDSAAADLDIYEGLLNISERTAEFYNRIFGMSVVAGESSPLGHDETWWDQRAYAESLGLTIPKDPSNTVAGLFMIEDLQEARRVFAEHNIPILQEITDAEIPNVIIIADPDGNRIALHEQEVRKPE